MSRWKREETAKEKFVIKMKKAKQTHLSMKGSVLYNLDEIKFFLDFCIPSFHSVLLLL